MPCGHILQVAAKQHVISTHALVNRRAAPPTVESANAAIEAALPSAKSIVDKTFDIAGDPIRREYQEKIKQDGADEAIDLAINRLLPKNWDWYAQWYNLREMEMLLSQ